MIFIFLLVVIFTGHDIVPGANWLGHVVMGALGSAPTPEMELMGITGWDPLVAGVVAIPYWFVLQLLIHAGEAGKGGTKGLDDE